MYGLWSGYPPAKEKAPLCSYKKQRMPNLINIQFYDTSFNKQIPHIYFLAIAVFVVIKHF